MKPTRILVISRCVSLHLHVYTGLEHYCQVVTWHPAIVWSSGSLSVTIHRAVDRIFCLFFSRFFCFIFCLSCVCVWHYREKKLNLHAEWGLKSQQGARKYWSSFSWRPKYLLGYPIIKYFSIPMYIRISTPQISNRLLGPPSLLSNGYRMLFPRG
jgi:hypothetical protein